MDEIKLSEIVSNQQRQPIRQWPRYSSKLLTLRCWKIVNFIKHYIKILQLVTDNIMWKWLNSNYRCENYCIY